MWGKTIDIVNLNFKWLCYCDGYYMCMKVFYNFVWEIYHVQRAALFLHLDNLILDKYFQFSCNFVLWILWQYLVKIIVKSLLFKKGVSEVLVEQLFGQVVVKFIIQISQKWLWESVMVKYKVAPSQLDSLYHIIILRAEKQAFLKFPS